jgi:3-deoxy-D-arabino-heptulosonate 7-phosphate (DAHP) synthase
MKGYLDNPIFNNAMSITNNIKVTRKMTKNLAQYRV